MNILYYNKYAYNIILNNKVIILNQQIYIDFNNWVIFISDKIFRFFNFKIFKINQMEEYPKDAFVYSACLKLLLNESTQPKNENYQVIKQINKIKSDYFIETSTNN